MGQQKTEPFALYTRSSFPAPEMSPASSQVKQCLFFISCPLSLNHFYRFIGEGGQFEEAHVPVLSAVASVVARVLYLLLWVGFPYWHVKELSCQSSLFFQFILRRISCTISIA